MRPACVRTSPGKEDGCDLKPFIVTQRVRRPPGKGGARQPEASLAWATATALVKRRQRVLKPCGSLEIMETPKPSPCWAGGSIGKAAMARIPVRPGSESRAKVREGSPGNLRDPACARVKAAGYGAPAEQCSRPGDCLGGDRERESEHEQPRTYGNPRRNHKPTAMHGGMS